MEKPSEERLLELFTGSEERRAPGAIALAIQRVILTSGVELGDKLPSERDLGRLFGVSRPSVREALRTLEAKGLIEVRRGVNGGAFVSAPKTNHVGTALSALIYFGEATPEQFAEFRISFEAQTARYAALRATDEEVGELREAAHRLREAAEPDVHWETFLERDIAFHELMAKASHNPIRVAVMLGVHGAFREFSMALASKEDLAWRRAQAAQVEEMVEAIGQHKSGLVMRLMKAHVMSNTSAWDLLVPVKGPPGRRRKKR